MKVARHEQRLAAAGATAVAVVHDEPDRVRGVLLEGTGWPYPVAIDTARASYRAWGLQRASWAGIWLDPAVWRQYAKLLGSGHRLRGSGQDPRQMGGDFVVDPAGRMAYARPQQRDDRPPAAVLTKTVEEVASEEP